MHLAALPPADVATTIIRDEEQMRGWMAYIARRRSMTHQVEASRRVQRQLENYCRTPVLAFHEQAAATLQRLRRARIRLGTMDLKIAAIGLSHDATPRPAEGRAGGADNRLRRVIDASIGDITPAGKNVITLLPYHRVNAVHRVRWLGDEFDPRLAAGLQIAWIESA
jgi:predicted nucleic acid-binding protein